MRYMGCLLLFYILFHFLPMLSQCRMYYHDKLDCLDCVITALNCIYQIKYIIIKILSVFVYMTCINRSESVHMIYSTPLFTFDGRIQWINPWYISGKSTYIKPLQTLKVSIMFDMCCQKEIFSKMILQQLLWPNYLVALFHFCVTEKRATNKYILVN